MSGYTVSSSLMNGRRPQFNPTEGMLVDDRYRLVRLLGQGGFGQVWKADDEKGKISVAIKLFTEITQKNPLWYWNELSILRSHRVPGIVALLDEGFWNGVPYLVMDLLDGSEFPGAEPNQVNEILERGVRLLDVLSLVHAEGILHHDIKPSNVLVTREGDIALLDFGIAADVQVDITQIGKYPYGSLDYMAPERLRGEPCSPQSDLYSVGVMLYEALVGELPFTADGELERISEILHKPAPRLITKVPALPVRIARLIDSMLFKSPSQRPDASSAARLLRGIEPEPIDVLPWLAAHGIDMDQDGSVSETQLVMLFGGMERLFHEPSSAAAELYRRTQGKPADILNEIHVWLEQGARFEGHQLIAGRRALRPPGPFASATATVSERLQRASAHITQGPLKLALQELMEAVTDLQNANGSPAQKDLDYERVLSVWMDIALADGTKQVLGPLQLELYRAPHQTPLIRKLDQLASAAAAIPAGGQKALDMLNDMEPFEDIRLEIRRHGLRSIACRRCDSRILEDTFRDIDQWKDKHPAEPMVLARYYFWQGWRHYQKSQYPRDARFHLRAFRIEAKCRDTWPITAASVLGCAASSLMETMGHPRITVSLAERALDKIKACESPFMEARAEWVLRTARYRNHEELDADEELITAVSRLVGAPDIEAQVHLTEAAFAFRKQKNMRAHELAQQAADIWMARMSKYYYGLAQAFAWMVGDITKSWEDIQAIRSDAIACSLAGIGLQTLAFLQCIVPDAKIAEPDLIDRLQEGIPQRYWDRRMDILSVEEARAMLGYPRLI